VETATRRPLADDTPFEAEEVQLALWRAMAPTAKAEAISSSSSCALRSGVSAMTSPSQRFLTPSDSALRHGDRHGIQPLVGRRRSGPCARRARRELRWYRKGGETSDRQWRDVVAIVRVQGPRLDRSYLTRGAAMLGVEDLLVQVLGQA
jgi:hypothetical protein